MDNLRRKIKELKGMLVEAFWRHYDTGLYSLTQHQHDHTVDDKKTFEPY